MNRSGQDLFSGTGRASDQHRKISRGQSRQAFQLRVPIFIFRYEIGNARSRFRKKINRLANANTIVRREHGFGHSRFIEVGSVATVQIAKDKGVAAFFDPQMPGRNEGIVEHEVRAGIAANREEIAYGMDCRPRPGDRDQIGLGNPLSWVENDALCFQR